MLVRMTAVLTKSGSDTGCSMSPDQHSMKSSPVPPAELAKIREANRHGLLQAIDRRNAVADELLQLQLMVTVG
jgi:uncharacterized membrane protein